MRYPEKLLRLVRALATLPGIGPKTAQKLGLYLVQHPEARLALQGSLEAAEVLRPCPLCGNLAEEALCPVCADAERDRGVICVVESVADLMAIERSGEYSGLYHVLGGALNPLEGVGPEQLFLEKLFERLEGVREVILATGMTVEGEATAAYLAERLAAHGVRSTRLAYGLPVGGSLEYADEVTLARALENRRGYG
ncbi:recombination protein RecR [Meiothermus sp. QL-1]|uniref:recombination mediator RecR n=1 Tax=Meiothermus sp. QL-1 TaxID=2058095 RepID=UPI000E0C478D|nr:recombination mediator RecR [Meiothermus sp. QL-1]RDI96529.1 recombination protein RecR [Meiothermus sp. QL-1]